MSTRQATAATCGCGAGTFHAVYKVPVYAVVEGGEVTRVVVADESIEGPLVVECPACCDNESDGAAQARAVAETATWPGWGFGW